MALTPLNKKHKGQILAGTTGRLKGHWFEEHIAETINRSGLKLLKSKSIEANQHIFTGEPAELLVNYIISKEKIDTSSITAISAMWSGGLATSENNNKVNKNKEKYKSDVIINIETPETTLTFGVSSKSCTAKTPTNDQLYFSTASAFCNLLRKNGITVSDNAEKGLKMFCGDTGFRPMDTGSTNINQERWYWEELDSTILSEWESIFTNFQSEITQLLLQKAYTNDPYPPTYLIHQTKCADDVNNSENAIFTIQELIIESKKNSGFALQPYYIRKGSHRDDTREHQAPRFGFVQFQRGGQKQHPTQLQFNLKAGYFYHLSS